MTATANNNITSSIRGAAKRVNLSVLLLAGACLVWSGEFLLLELCLGYLPAACCNVLRLGAGAAALLLISRLRDGRVKLTAKENLRLWLAGAALTAYYYLENRGVAITSGATASLLLALIPIVGLAADRIFFGQPISGKKALAALISIGGILLIVSGDGSATGNSVNGSLFMLAAVLMWVAYMTLVKPLLDKYSATLLVSRLLLAACVCSLPLTLPELPTAVACPTPILLLAALIGICCTAGADMLYLSALSRVSLSLAAMAENFIPVTTVLLSFVILGHVPALNQLLGGAIILAALLLTSQHSPQPPQSGLASHSHVGLVQNARVAAADARRGSPCSHPAERPGTLERPRVTTKLGGTGHSARVAAPG